MLDYFFFSQLIVSLAVFISQLTCRARAVFWRIEALFQRAAQLVHSIQLMPLVQTVQTKERFHCSLQSCNCMPKALISINEVDRELHVTYDLRSGAICHCVIQLWDTCTRQDVFSTVIIDSCITRKL